jgi:mannitol-1-phosphate 5-dehydrogenase
MIWGAGRIGRGLLGDMFHQAGYGIVFVDRNERVVENLNTRPEYTVYDLFEGGSVSQVSGYKAIHLPQREAIMEELDDCPLMAVAVLPEGFPDVVDMLHTAIRKRLAESSEKTLDIIVCTNMFDPGQKLKEQLTPRLSADEKAYCEKYFGFVSALTRRLAIDPEDAQRAQDPLSVVVSGLSKLPVNVKAFKGSLPQVDRLIYVDNMPALELRKYYTYNMLHATLAYMGSFRGHTYAYESIADSVVMQTARGALEEIGETLMDTCGFTQTETDEWNEAAIRMLDNPALKDTMERLGADTSRKLVKGERLVGPVLLCRDNGVWPYYLTKSIAHAFLFAPDADAKSQMVSEYARVYGVKEAAKRFCGLENEPEILELINMHYERARADSQPEDDVKVALMKRAYHLGFTCEKTYKGCAQGTLNAMFQLTGQVNEGLFQSASGFSGGMAICGDGVCGGYAGGIMFMGSYAGRRYHQMMADGDKEAQYASYDMAQRLHDRMVKTYGSVICRDIHKQIFGRDYCLRTKAVREDFENAGAHTTKCTNVVGTASAYIAEILYDTGYIDGTTLEKEFK